jgi:hypothetical protein
LTAETGNNKHFTADGNLTWNMDSGNTVTTWADIEEGFQPNATFSGVVTFEGGSSVHITAVFETVTVTD